MFDSKAPTESFREFLLGQVRYSSIEKAFPDKAEELFSKAEEYAKEKYLIYKQMSEAETTNIMVDWTTV
jgi:pyruvate-ferredoxin/flavodoxin oxidoreductase